MALFGSGERPVERFPNSFEVLNDAGLPTPKPMPAPVVVFRLEAQQASRSRSTLRIRRKRRENALAHGRCSRTEWQFRKIEKLQASALQFYLALGLKAAMEQRHHKGTSLTSPSLRFSSMFLRFSFQFQPQLVVSLPAHVLQHPAKWFIIYHLAQ